ncbi:MAG: hypothetical protein AB7G76_15750 [Steroidobacteraceae bacterium]
MDATLRFATMVGLIAFAGPGRAATPVDALPEALAQCAAERDDTRRLACYDAEVARLAKQPPPPTAEEKFGARGDLVREQERTAEPAEPRLTRLEATVTAIAARPGGELVITLDNGQVWHQLPTGERFRLEVGDKVVVKRGALGSYSMASPYGRAVKVRRTK